MTPPKLVIIASVTAPMLVFIAASMTAPKIIFVASVTAPSFFEDLRCYKFDILVLIFTTFEDLLEGSYNRADYVLLECSVRPTKVVKISTRI